MNLEPGADRKFNEKEMSQEDACSVYQDYEDNED